MESKFWNRDGTSSASDSENDSESEAPSDAESEDDVRTKKATIVPPRWAAMEDSSSDDDERRVVRSAKDKRWDQLRQIIKSMQNQKNIDDFAELQSGLESLLKGMVKAKAIVEKEGIPPFFVRAIAELDKYINDKFANKDVLKKSSKTKMFSFNTLRSKARKGLEEYKHLIEDYNKNPSKFIDEEEEEIKALSSSSSEDSFDDDSTDSNETSDSDISESSDEEDDDSALKKRRKHSGSESDDWEESDASEEMLHGGDDDAQQRVLKLWGKKNASGTKPEGKKHKEKMPRQTKTPKLVLDSVSLHGRPKATPILFPGEKVDADLLTKKLKDVISLRGRKGFDRMEQIRHLNELSEAAKLVGPQSQLEILGHLISAYFDANLGAFMAMPPNQWSQCYEELTNALKILRREKDCYFPFLVPEDDDDNCSIVEPDQEVIMASATATGPSSTTALLKVQQQQRTHTGEGTFKETKARLETALTLTRFLERLDDELIKALQLTDIHSEEYKVRLGQTIDLLALLWKAYMHFVQTGQQECAKNISLRVLEQIYYKKDSIAARMWDVVKKRLDPIDAEPLTGPQFVASSIVRKLVDFNLADSLGQSSDVRLILYLAYSESLHGHFYEARDLLQTANVQEFASQCNISTQIFFNRNLVQLGLAAFRLGLITEAHSYLSEVCAMGRYKELLAQGLSNIPRGMEKNPEQERLEKRRLLPYHMHIAADLVEAVHNICAMLLEVPYMAANPFDYSKKPIARNFRRLLEIYDRQIFTGPPENPRESIMAATKALQKGNWKLCSEYIMSLKIWESLSDAETVKHILTDRIKQEALRTHLFSYSSLYDSFSIKQLADMFSLPPSTAHSIVSKMVIQGLLSGSWDGASECVLINRVERTPLQLLALQLTEKIAQSVDQNEMLLAYRNPKFVLAQANQRDERNRRFDDGRWGNTDRRNFGDQIDRSGGNSFFSFNGRMNGNQNDRLNGGGLGRYGNTRNQGTGITTGNIRRRWLYDKRIELDNAITRLNVLRHKLANVYRQPPSALSCIQTDTHIEKGTVFHWCNKNLKKVKLEDVCPKVSYLVGTYKEPDDCHSENDDVATFNKKHKQLKCVVECVPKHIQRQHCRFQNSNYLFFQKQELVHYLRYIKRQCLWRQQRYDEVTLANKLFQSDHNQKIRKLLQRKYHILHELSLTFQAEIDLHRHYLLKLLYRVFQVKAHDPIYSLHGFDILSSRDYLNRMTLMSSSDFWVIGTSLGFLCHLTTLLSTYLDIPIPNEFILFSSKSFIRELLPIGQLMYLPMSIESTKANLTDSTHVKNTTLTRNDFDESRSSSNYTYQLLKPIYFGYTNSSLCVSLNTTKDINHMIPLNTIDITGRCRFGSTLSVSLLALLKQHPISQPLHIQQDKLIRCTAQTKVVGYQLKERSDQTPMMIERYAQWEGQKKNNSSKQLSPLSKGNILNHSMYDLHKQPISSFHMIPLSNDTESTVSYSLSEAGWIRSVPYDPIASTLSLFGIGNESNDRPGPQHFSLDLRKVQTHTTIPLIYPLKEYPLFIKSSNAIDREKLSFGIHRLRDTIIQLGWMYDHRFPNLNVEEQEECTPPTTIQHPAKNGVRVIEYQMPHFGPSIQKSTHHIIDGHNENRNILMSLIHIFNCERKKYTMKPS